MTKTLVDTNILIYSLHKNEGKKHEISSELIGQLIDRNEITLSIQNLVEFSRVMSDKSVPSIDKEIIRQNILEFSVGAYIIYYNVNTIGNALTIAKNHGIHFFDALLAATMEENFISEIITENEKDFKRIPGLKVVNPFK